MARLKNYNGRFCESDFENTLLSLLEKENWTYMPGNKIPRESYRDVLYLDDLEAFLAKIEPKLTNEDIRQVADKVRLAGAENDFAT